MHKFKTIPERKKNRCRAKAVGGAEAECLYNISLTVTKGV
jgi:hypothetical protein